MNNPIVIAVDAMGGDNSPDKIIDGIELYSKENKNIGHIAFRTIIDSCIEYGSGTATVSFTKYIPIIGEVIMAGEHLPIIGKVFKELLWSIGYGLTYVLNNMISNIDSMNIQNMRSMSLLKSLSYKTGLGIRLNH